MSKKRILGLSIILGIWLTGCNLNQPEASPGGEYYASGMPVRMAGNWSSAWDKLSISETVYTYFCDTDGNIAVKGNIEEAQSVSSTGDSGYLVVLITESSADCGPFNMDYSYFTAGQYTVMKWSNLNASGSASKLATPYSASLAESYALKADAVAAIVTDPSGDANFFAFLGDYTK